MPDFDRHLLSRFQVLVKLSRLSDDGKIRRDCLLYELLHAGGLPAAFQEAKAFIKNEFLRVPGPVAQFLLDISGQVAPGKKLQRRNGIRLGISSQSGGDLGACQLDSQPIGISPSTPPVYPLYTPCKPPVIPLYSNRRGLQGV